MGRDGERCQTIYFFIYVMSGMGSATPVVVLDPHVLPNTAETFPGPSLGLCPFDVLIPSCPCLLRRQGWRVGSKALTQGLIQVL